MLISKGDGRQHSEDATHCFNAKDFEIKVFISMQGRVIQMYSTVISSTYIEREAALFKILARNLLTN